MEHGGQSFIPFARILPPLLLKKIHYCLHALLNEKICHIVRKHCGGPRHFSQMQQKSKGRLVNSYPSSSLTVC